MPSYNLCSQYIDKYGQVELAISLPDLKKLNLIFRHGHCYDVPFMVISSHGKLNLCNDPDGYFNDGCVVSCVRVILLVAEMGSAGSDKIVSYLIKSAGLGQSNHIYIEQLDIITHPHPTSKGVSLNFR